MMLLVAGGSASGKSEYAEQRAMSLARETGYPLFYLATMMPYGEEAAARIERHRRLRADKGFETIERYTDILGLCRGAAADENDFCQRAAQSTVLLECMSNLTANELFHDRTVDAEQKIIDGIGALKTLCRHLIVVTIDVFGDGTVYDESTEAYRRCLGRINRCLTEMADEMIEVVYTIPIYHKKHYKIEASIDNNKS